MRRRLCQRFTKRLEVTFSSGTLKYRGISSDLSAGGLFIRTQNGLAPGNLIDIEIYLPENKVGRLKGIVRRTVKSPMNLVKNGMGIELVERDPHYLDFLKNFDIGSRPEEDTSRPSEKGIEDREAEKTPESRGGEAGKEKPGAAAEPPPESVIIICQSCKVKNKVPRERLWLGPKCGRCGTVLDTRVSG